MGYLRVTSPNSWCPAGCLLPQLTSGIAGRGVGIGSVYECPRCRATWKLARHETGTRSAAWTQLTEGAPRPAPEPTIVSPWLWRLVAIFGALVVAAFVFSVIFG